jgi:hypothetical protein
MQKAFIENYQDYQDAIEIVPSAQERKNTYGVYTMDGQLIRTPWQGIDNLPKGMYIINKRKVLVR